MARNQANPSLAGTAGHVLPISRHQPGERSLFEDLPSNLKVGEVSQIIECPRQDCYAISSSLEIYPPAKT